jgi:hypothetical protein
MHHNRVVFRNSRFQILPTTGYLEPVSIRVVGTTDEPADIPLAAEESEVGE